MLAIDSAGLVATSFRTLPPLDVVRAESVGEALQELRRAKRPAILAGGTDLPARFNVGDYPDIIIDIAKIKQLHAVFIDKSELVIGAAVTHQSGSTHALLPAVIPGFQEAWKKIANMRIRMSGTLGGNIMSRRTRYEGAILLAALNAQLEFATLSGPLFMAAGDLWDAELPVASLLQSIRIPIATKPRLDYERSLRPIFTQAFYVDDTGAGRLVSATEFVRPHIWAFDRNSQSNPSPEEIDFQDPVMGTAYLNQVRAVFFMRQMTRLGLS